MKVLGIDLETTGLDFTNDRIIEIGAVLYDTDLKIPLKIFSEFINEPDRPIIDKTKVPTDISDETIKDYGYEVGVLYCRKNLFEQLNDLFEEAEYVVAHNGNKFDKSMLEAFFERYEIPFPELSWIDTMTDIEYPLHCSARNLIYLAGYHGFVNPFQHRAVFDVMTMLRILSSYDIEEVIERTNSLTITIKANVSYADKEKAKSKQFMWDSTKKIWFKEIKECDLTKDWISSLDFEIDILD